jgi:hypothetical protein
MTSKQSSLYTRLTALDAHTPQTRQTPFKEQKNTSNWRGFQLYGAAMLGDWAAHIIDFAHDYLQLGLPTRIEPLEPVNANPVTYPGTENDLQGGQRSLLLLFPT